MHRILFSIPLFLFTATAADRPAAEWVLHLGGNVVVEGSPERIWDPSRLPAGDFQLRRVDLAGVVVDPDQLSRLSGLTGLKELYLSGRTWHSMPLRVSAESLKHLRTLTSLEKFVLSLPVQTEIPMEDEGIANLAPLTHLKEMRLAQTRVRGHTLAPFVEMRLLDLDHTRLDDAGMKNVENMPNLERLYARDTMVTDEGLKSLRSLRHLKELDLYGTRITDAGLPVLKELTELTRLNLLGANVTDAGLENLLGLTKLRELNLYRTRITNSGAARLTSLKQLRDLDLRYTQVTAGGVRALRAGLPETRVAFLDVTAGAGKETGDADLRKVASSCASTELKFAHAAISDSGLASLANCRSLRKLDISYTFVQGEGLANLPDSIVDLDLAGNSISNDALIQLARLQESGIARPAIHGYLR